MKKILDCTEAELNESVRLAVENWGKQGRDSSAERLLKAIEPHRDSIKRGLRARASLSSLCAHLEAAGVKCSADCLREALNRGGYRRPRSGKADGVSPDLSPGPDGR